MSSFLRPDERASLETIEKAKERDKAVKTTAKTAIGLGTAAIGGGVGAKILPFLSEYIPMDLAVKGISKVSPKIGDFLKRGMSQGLDIKEGLNFVKDSITKPQEAKQAPAVETPKETPFDLLGKYSPKLAEYFRSQLQKGEKPGIVRLLAQQDFPNEVKQIEKDHKRSFKEVINDLFEGKAPIQPSQAQPSQPEQQPQAAQGVGPGQQKLMDMLQKLNQKLGG